MKKCNKCQEVKPLVEFYVKRYKSGLVGHRSKCMTCSVMERDEWRHKNWAKDTARNNAYNKRNHLRVRGHKLKKYWPGTTPEQANANYEALLAAQGGGCGICSQVKKAYHVDHCHSTKVVRGILCNACNRGIGMLQDSVAIVQSALTYVTKHKK